MTLHIAKPERYPELSRLIDPESCGAIYSYSAVNRTQQGILYTDENESILLVHHACGFAMLHGAYTEEVLSEIKKMILNPAPYHRMLFFAADARAAEYFSKQDDLIAEQRLFFRYTAEQMPSDEGAVRITPEILEKIHGRIVPSFSWEDMTAFLEKGVGYCVMQNGEPAAWAFSAAVSAREIDIGVETDERYRRQGHASKAAAAMIRETIVNGKMPVWACHAGNTASRKLAESLGFSLCGQCTTFRRQP